MKILVSVVVLIAWIVIGVLHAKGEPWDEWFIWFMYGLCVLNTLCELLKRITEQ